MEAPAHNYLSPGQRLAARAAATVLLAFLTISACLWAAPAAAPARAVPDRAAWEWPLSPKPEVLRQFDLPAQPWLSGHRGVDLKTAPGQQIRAPADGTIAFAGWVVDRPVLSIDHRGGLRSSYESVRSTLPIGEPVVQGQPVGTVSEPWHCGSTACMHWGLRRHGAYINPLQFVTDLRPSVLLPLP